MKKVYQKEFYESGVSTGDCLRACIESITEIDNLPNYTKIGHYFPILKENKLKVDEDVDFEMLEFYNLAFDFVIGIGQSARKCDHACVYDLKGNLVHDLDPSCFGVNVRYFYYFVIE